MKKSIKILILIVFALLISTSSALADKPVQLDANGNEIAWEHSNASCASIQDGTITDSAGNPLSTGYDQFGYNYQAHMFNGTYDSSDRVLDGKYWGSTEDYVDDKLMMKWSDEWLSNVDCNNDHKLDRGLVNGWVGGTSLGWETNHVEGDYIDADGNLQHYTYFAKIVWIGPGGDLWGQYSMIMENYQDPTGMMHYHEAAPGFGLNDQWTTTDP
jgi:hypothetical protein